MKKYLVPLIIAAAVLVASCGGSAEEPDMTAQAGDTVKVDYTGTLADGTEFDSSFGREPLEFTVGDGSMIPGFDQAVVGMAVGESKNVVIPADDAYGPSRDDLVIEIERDNLDPGLNPQIGQQLRLRSTDGQEFQVMVIEVSESTVTVDANHPLAGKDLNFDILLVEIL